METAINIYVTQATANFQLEQVCVLRLLAPGLFLLFVFVVFARSTYSAAVVSRYICFILLLLLLLYMSGGSSRRSHDRVMNEPAQ